MAVLQGQVAIVTGAGQGVGHGIALALAKEGAAVVLASRTESKVQAVAREIESFGGRAAALGCDVGDESDIRATVALALSRYGRIDILVNNAYDGAFGEIPIATGNVDAFRRGFETGPVASLLFMQACYPHMKKQGGGAIINLGSAAGVRWDMSGFGFYGSLKEAIRVLTRAAACEWGVDNIRVNTICPIANTPAQIQRAEQFPEMVKAFRANIPQRRLGDCEKDIGRAVVFLCGPDATYLSGATIPLDSGFARFG